MAAVYYFDVYHESWFLKIIWIMQINLAVNKKDLFEKNRTGTYRPDWLTN